MFVMSQNTHLRVSWRPLVEECKILACDDTNLKKGGAICNLRLLKCAVFTSLLWIVGELAAEGLSLWLLAVGCLHSNGTSAALQRHFNDTSMALPWHFHGTSTALQRHFNGRKKKRKKMVSVLLSASVKRFSFSHIIFKS